MAVAGRGSVTHGGRSGGEASGGRLEGTLNGERRGVGERVPVDQLLAALLAHRVAAAQAPRIFAQVEAGGALGVGLGHCDSRLSHCKSVFRTIKNYNVNQDA